jgi:hypothetical protein
MGSVACKKFHVNSFLLINTQENLLRFSLPPLQTGRLFCSHGVGDVDKKKTILYTSRQHANLSHNACILLMN